MAPNFAGQIYLKMSVFSLFLEGWGTKKLHMRDRIWRLNMNLIPQSRYQRILSHFAQILWSKRQKITKQTHYSNLQPFSFYLYCSYVHAVLFQFCVHLATLPLNCQLIWTWPREIYSVFPPKEKKNEPSHGWETLLLLGEAFSAISTADTRYSLHEKSLLLLFFPNQIFQPTQTQSG